MIELYNEDCMSKIKDIDNNSIDLIITDPPYGVEYSKGFNDSKDYVKDNISNWLNEMYRVLKDGSHCYIFIPTKEAGMWLSEIEKIFTFNNILATRTYTSSVYLKNNYQFNTQLIVYCSKGIAKRLNDYDFFKTSECWFNDKRNKNPKEYTYSYPSFIKEEFSNIKTTNKNKDTRHPCEKNYKLLKFFVGVSSNVGDTILDLFMGSGSVGIACKSLDRNFIGIEKNKNYFDIACKNINEFNVDIITNSKN